MLTSLQTDDSVAKQAEQTNASLVKRKGKRKAADIDDGADMASVSRTSRCQLKITAVTAHMQDASALEMGHVLGLLVKKVTSGK